MSLFACGRCEECDGGRGYEFCLHPCSSDGRITPEDRIAQLERELAEARESAKTFCCAAVSGTLKDGRKATVPLQHLDKDLAEGFKVEKVRWDCHGPPTILEQVTADRDEWKRKAEETLKEYEVGRAEVLVLRKELLELASKEKEECNCEDYADMQSERDVERDRAIRAEAAAGELRRVLEPIPDILKGVAETLHKAARPDLSALVVGHVAVVKAALSSDAGRGWVSPEEHGRLKEWARKAVPQLEVEGCLRPNLHEPCKNQCPICALLAEAEALELSK